MFYEKSLTTTFRMGDVVSGFMEILPVYEVNSEVSQKKVDFNLKFTNYDYFVILTPCCSIEKEKATIVPLKKIDSNYLKSEYLYDNFLLINNPILRRHVLGDERYLKIPEDERLRCDNMITYELLDVFIYEGHELFEPYEMKTKIQKDKTISKMTNRYMLSFKDAMTVQSKIFNRGANNLIKVLELSTYTRKELRDKLTHFYSRIPQEDM